jgi:pimeloyl-ACP methyl ester carboxylesterase
MPTTTSSADGRAAGAANVLVLVHGSGDSARCWADALSRLSDLALRVVALDLPGHGARIAEPLPEPTADAYADWVRDHLHAQGVRRAVVAGHSLGSAIALRLALERPGEIAHAVLIGAGARLRVLPALLERARTEPAATMAELVALGHAPANAALAHTYFAALAPTTPAALANDLQACDGFDVMSQLDALRVATTILVGAEDRLTPPKYAQYLAEHIPGAQLRVVTGAGHYLTDEAPDAVARALRQALG